VPRPAKLVGDPFQLPDKGGVYVFSENSK